MRVQLDPNLDAAMRTAPASHRAGLFPNAGLWYDAVAAAADLNQRQVLDALMNEVGLAEPARYDLQAAGGVKAPLLLFLRKAAIGGGDVLRIPSGDRLLPVMNKQRSQNSADVTRK